MKANREEAEYCPLTGFTGSIRNTEPPGNSTTEYRWVSSRRLFLRHSMVGGGLPTAEQTKVATRPETTNWSRGGVMIRGGWPGGINRTVLVKAESMQKKRKSTIVFFIVKRALV